MTRANPLQSAFNAGELSPRIHARTDLDTYYNGLETCLNIIPLAEGGAMRRPGERYVAEVKDSSKKVRLRDFIFSTVQAYMLEMGEEYIRFYRNQGQIQVDGGASISNGTFDSNITGWTDQSNGTGSVSHNSTLNALELDADGSGNQAIAEQEVTHSSSNNEHILRFRVIGIPGDSVTVRVGSSSGGSQYLADFEASVGYHALSFTPTGSPFYVQFESGLVTTINIDDVSLPTVADIGSPYAEADLFEVEGPQSADTLYFFHESYRTHRLERRGNTTWSLVEVEWIDGPYLDTNTTATTLSPASASGENVTITASATTGINGDDGFQSTDVGRLVRIDNGSTDWGYGIIFNVTSTTSVDVHVKRDFSGATGSAVWALGSWSDTTGHPRAGAFFEQRLWGGGTVDQPQTIWASETGNFETFSPDSPNSSGDWDGTVEDDDGFSYTLSADTVNTIFWMSPGEDTLAIGTRGGEWVPTSSGVVITPSDIAIRRHTTHGSKRVQPERVGNVVLFVQRAGRKVREFGFRFEVDGFQALDLTRLAEHITAPGTITQMAYQQEPDSLLYCVREDGQLLVMTYRPEERVVGWARWIFGGSFGSGDPVCESVSTIPGEDDAGQIQNSGDRDEVWVSVKRTIDGNTKRYIGVMERDFEDGDNQEDSYYSDSLITYDGSATNTITGLDHLEGETVKVYADGAILPDKTVSSGSITLEDTYEVVQVGLGYTHRLKTLKAEFGAQAGSAVTKIKRIHKLGFVFLNSHIVSFGPNATTLQTKDFRQVGDAMDSAVPLLTGERVYSFEGGWERDARIVVESDAPAPFTLLAIAPQLRTNEQV